MRQCGTRPAECVNRSRGPRMHAASRTHAHDDRLVGDSERRLASVAAVQAPPPTAALVPERAHGPDMGGRDGTWSSPVLTVSPMSVYLGHLTPTTPKHAGPEWMPTRMRIVDPSGARISSAASSISCETGRRAKGAGKLSTCLAASPQAHGLRRSNKAGGQARALETWSGIRRQRRRAGAAGCLGHGEDAEVVVLSAAEVVTRRHHVGCDMPGEMTPPRTRAAEMQRLPDPACRHA